MADLEKDPNVDGHGLEKTSSQESHLSSDERINVFTPAEQKKIIRRIDVRLVTTLGLMYCVSLMDRTVSPRTTALLFKILLTMSIEFGHCSNIWHGSWSVTGHSS